MKRIGAFVGGLLGVAAVTGLGIAVAAGLGFMVRVFEWAAGG